MGNTNARAMKPAPDQDGTVTDNHGDGSSIVAGTDIGSTAAAAAAAAAETPPPVAAAAVARAMRGFWTMSSRTGDLFHYCLGDGGARGGDVDGDGGGVDGDNVAADAVSPPAVGPGHDAKPAVPFNGYQVRVLMRFGPRVLDPPPSVLFAVRSTESASPIA